MPYKISRDIVALEAKYFTPSPASFAKSRITPLLDATDYHLALDTALSSLGLADPATNKANGDFILVANWWLGLVGGDVRGMTLTDGVLFRDPAGTADDYVLSAGDTPLAEILKSKARAGVDVRVMAWVSTTVLDTLLVRLFEQEAESFARIGVMSIESVLDLRSEPEIGDKAIINIMSHTAGAAHAKLVVIGNDTEAIGFTGGLDFVMNRFTATLDHSGGQQWHDVVAQVEGPAVQGLYDWFFDHWMENTHLGPDPRDPEDFLVDGVQVPHIGPNTPALDPRDFSALDKGKHHVQSLRTLPAKNYQVLSFEPPQNGFPDGGVFEIRDAWLKAIGAADAYIYIEDQGFTSHDILAAVNDRIKNNPALRVILIMSGQDDPNDPTRDTAPVWTESINHGLLEGLTGAQGTIGTQMDQVRVFKRFQRVPDAATTDTIIASATSSGLVARVQTEWELFGVPANAFDPDRSWLEVSGVQYRIVGNDPVPTTGGLLNVTVETPTSATISPGPCRLIFMLGVTIHSKTTLIDDHWALIGSANCMQRSLYTDSEHSVAVLDEDDLVVKEYRKRLWSHQFVHGTPADFDDIQSSLRAWEPNWGMAGPAPARWTAATGPLKEFLVPVPLPLPERRMTPEERNHYNMLDDPDSRQAWGLVQ
jgi:phosphatidylserine/phosphatidylglycerophosphate/cardiolipin synthase-like enzyme